MQRQALALVTDSVIKSPLKDYLTRSCHRAGLSLGFHSVTHDCKSYVERFKAHQNIITWNCRMPHEWMTNKGKNLLFIENSLLMQRSGVFVDAGGLYSHLNLCRDSRRTWRRRPLTTVEDNAYGYDGLSQVVQDARGNLNLNQTAISAVPISQENWDYDPTGNWRGYETQASGSVTLDQHRVHDRGNRLTQIEGDPSPILLDRAGRMRQVPPDASGDWDESLELKWDAWGRITQVKRVSDEEVLGSYAYDAKTRRIGRDVGSAVQHSYYSDQLRPLEERKDAETDASAQYLWGVRHRDDLVRRDRDSNDDTELDEKRYVLMDYYSPASITDENGEVKERYSFSAFGMRRIMAPNWSPRSTSESDWEFSFQGQFSDAESGLLNYGFRYYSPHLGRWTFKDPIGIEGGLNLYEFCGNGPTLSYDAYGLAPCGEFNVKEDPDVEGSGMTILGNVHYSGRGYNVQFKDDGCCTSKSTCKPGQIYLSQSIKNVDWNGGGWFFDTTATQDRYNKRTKRVQIPEFLHGGTGAYSLSDSPGGNSGDYWSGKWELEICAICATPRPAGTGTFQRCNRLHYFQMGL